MHSAPLSFRSLSTALAGSLPILRAVLFSALLAVMFVTVDGTLPASAATGDVLDTITAPSPSNAGRGLTFDGDNLWYTAKNETNLYRITVSDHSSVLIATDLPREAWALAWDGEELWAAIDTDPTTSVEKFYTVNRITGVATWRFDVDLSAPLPPIGGRMVDGFAYDFTTGTFWVSEDGSETIFNISKSGDILRQFQIAGFSSYNSGIASDGTTLWLATFECCSPYDFRIKNYYPDGTLSDQILLSGSTNLREDMDFDPISFRNQSKCAIWATQGKTNPNIVAYEVPCDPGGYAASHYGNLSSEANPSVGDPVNPIFGNFNHQQTDIGIPTRGLPLAFTRTYNSAASSVDGPLGFGWTHNYNMHLEFEPAGALVVIQPDGRKDRYLSLGGGAYLSPPDFFDTLQESGGIYTLTTVSQVKYAFDSAGKLTSIADRNNNATNLAYYPSGPDTGRLQTVTEPTGRTLTFTYTSGRILRVTESAPLARYVEFTYDVNGNLETVRDVNGGITTYTYSSSHQLEKAKDSNNNWSVQNCYDSGTGKVTKQFGSPFPNGLEPPASNCLLDRAGANAAGLLLTEFQYNTPAGGQTTLRDPRNFATVYKFDNLFRVVKITDALSGATEYTYDSHSNRTCVKDPRGNRTSYSYDAKGNVTRMADAQHTDTSCNLKPPPDDKAWNYSFTTMNDIAAETDPLNRETQYVYDSPGNLTRIVRRETPGGTIKSLTCFEYKDLTAPGRHTAVLNSTDLVLPGLPTDDCTGNRTKFEYNDAYDNLTATINPRFSGAGTPKTTFTVDAGGRTTTITNELGHATTNAYDLRGALLSTTDQLGNTTSFTYDNKGNLKTVTDANRKANGTPETGCGTLGTGDQADNDADTQVDDGCPSTIYSYDGGDRLTQVIDALGNPTAYGYDPNGNRTSMTDANRQPVGAASEADIQGACGLLGTGDGNNQDSLDDSVADDGCPSMIYTYDSLRRLEKQIDGIGRVALYQYDPSGNLIARADANHGQAGQASESDVQCGSGPGDGADNDGDGTADDGCPNTFYTYDNLARVTKIEHWRTWTLRSDTVDYTFDAVGNRLSATVTAYDNSGTALPPRVTYYGYDTLNRLRCVGGLLIADPLQCPVGTPASRANVAYRYDTLLDTDPPAKYPDERTRITYPDGKAVDYTYDQSGNMNTVKDWLAKQTSYTYFNSGHRLRTTYAGTGNVQYGYDGADRLATVTHNKTGSITLTYDLDAVGNRKQVTRGNATETYLYDPLYRLTKVTYPDTSETTYTYDPAGNRMTHSSSGGGLSYEYDSANELKRTYVPPAQSQTLYSYDKNGNLIGRAAETYKYDQENRLKTISFGGFDPAEFSPPMPCLDFNGDGTPGLTDVLGFIPVFGSSAPGPPYDPFYDVKTTGSSANKIDLADILAFIPQFQLPCPRYFSYDADGLRTSQTLGKYVTAYDWDLGRDLPVVLQETRREDNTGDVRSTTTYVYGLDVISTTDDSGNQRYYFPDALGSTMTTISGATGQDYEYDVFGKLRAGVPGSERFLFTGEWFDTNARQFDGLYYLRARYYDPTIGRFLTRDPLPGSVRSPQSLNAYLYVGNNPVNRVDPSGMLSESTRDTTLSCIAAGLFLSVAVGFFFLAFTTLSPAAIAAADLFLLAGSLGSAGFVYNLDQCLGPDGGR